MALFLLYCFFLRFLTLPHIQSPNLVGFLGGAVHPLGNIWKRKIAANVYNLHMGWKHENVF